MTVIEEKPLHGAITVVVGSTRTLSFVLNDRLKSKQTARVDTHLKSREKLMHLQKVQLHRASDEQTAGRKNDDKSICYISIMELHTNVTGVQHQQK